MDHPCVCVRALAHARVSPFSTLGGLEGYFKEIKCFKNLKALASVVAIIM